MRPIYRRDRDRIVHSNAFRRLDYKTQVFIYREDDHYRTRLTHTLEVSQIARSVALALGLHEEFTEALSLAHDLGHPPFGHAGEDSLRECMRHFGGFEHNAQALRVVDRLERRYTEFDGLNLSYELRESLFKHGARAADGEGQDIEARPLPLLEAQIVDIADSTAYHHHDLDDGLRSGMLEAQELESLEVWRTAREVQDRENPRTRGQRRIAGILGRILSMSIEDLINASEQRLLDTDPASADEARECGERLIGFSEPMRTWQTELQRFLFKRVYRSGSVLQQRIRSQKIVKELFRAFTSEPQRLPKVYRELAHDVGQERAVADYIAGMTDRFAERSVHDLDAPGTHRDESASPPPHCEEG